ncbi:MAG: cytochrome C6 [Synechococcaceae cyanobacterium]|nr:cytochrome C6 [Synechococcaceae cyanobacterium]
MRFTPLRRLFVLLAVLLLVFWAGPVWGLAEDGGRLFELSCAGCHPRGGNIIRRGRTLRLEALRRQGIEGPAAVAQIAAEGIGRMGGYREALGPGGAERVGDWVWRQAEAGWPAASAPAASAKSPS